MLEVGNFNNIPILYNNEKDTHGNIYLYYKNKKMPHKAVVNMLPYDNNSYLQINMKGDIIS